MCDPVKGYGGDYSKEQGNLRVKKWELYSVTLGRRGGNLRRSGGLCEEAGESEEVRGSAKRQGTLQRSGAPRRSRGLCEEAGRGGGGFAKNWGTLRWSVGIC